MNRALLTPIIVLLLLVALPAVAEETAPEIPAWTPEPVISQHTGYTLIKAELPGRLIAVTEQTDTSGSRRLILLAGEQSDPEAALRIFSLDPSGDSPLREIRHDLPADTRTLFTLDLNGDGTPEPVIGRPGGLYALPADGEPELLIETRGFLPRIAEQWRSGDDSTLMHHLTLAGVGFLHDYRFTPGAKEFMLLRDEQLQVAVTRRRDGLFLRTPLPVQLNSLTDEPPLLAIGPVTRGKQRLLSLMVDLSDQTEEVTALENWSRLPLPEDVTQRWFRLINGEPALVVTTLYSEKKGAFEKKKLRVFMLGADRTRGGADAILEIQTPSRQWFDSSITVTDINTDGRDDLVVVVPEGLGGGKLQLEGYLGQAEGGFKPKPRRTMLEKSVKDWHFGGDLNGDGIGDLVVIEDNNLTAYAGIAGPSATALFQENPLWKTESETSETTVEVSIGATSGDITVSGGVAGLGGRLQVRDLVGDSRAEVMLVTSVAEHGRGTVVLILPE